MLDIYPKKILGITAIFLSVVGILLLIGEPLPIYTIIPFLVGIFFGYCYLTKPLCSVNKNSLVIYSFVGTKTKTIKFSSLANLEVEGNNIYYRRDPVTNRRKKLPINKWEAARSDWEKFLLLIAEEKKTNNSNVS